MSMWTKRLLQGSAVTALALALTAPPASAQWWTNSVEPWYDPIDTAAEPAAGYDASAYGAPAAGVSSNPIEPRYDPIDTPAEPAAGAAARIRRVPVWAIDEKDVYNRRGEELGEVEHVVVGPGNKIYAVVEFGEFLGLGGEERLVPLSRLALRGDDVIIPGMTEAELRALPVYSDDLVGYRVLGASYLAPMPLYAGTNRFEPGYDPIDTAAEPRDGAAATGAVGATNRIEPGFDPIDTAAEGYYGYLGYPYYPDYTEYYDGIFD